MHTDPTLLGVPGADPGFFLGGGALVPCSTSTPINHIVFFFCRIPVVLENRRSLETIADNFSRKILPRGFLRGVGLAYRKWSIKRRGAYFIFHVKGAALIRGFNNGENTKGNTERTLSCAMDKYVHLEPLYEPGFKSFPTLQREKLTSWSWSYLSSNMVFISLSRKVPTVTTARN